ncbi:MAG: hypothetical protein LBQ14_10195 [Treponema sp.]|jgi:hypothetical protein|nr:hypothetical protein [Treponema sp.]
MTESALASLAILRRPQETMHWYIIPLLVIVQYIYFHEIRKKHIDVVLGGLALWGMDLFNEVWNSIVFHATGYAPVWGAPRGDTALQLLIGYNVEISFMFAIAGIIACTGLPRDPKKKILGVNNRILLTGVYALIGVAVEIFLNYAGVLSWDYPWWNARAPWLIWLIGYVPFFAAAFLVHDMKVRKNQFKALGYIYGVDILLLIIFGIMGWM